MAKDAETSARLRTYYTGLEGPLTRIERAVREVRVVDGRSPVDAVPRDGAITLTGLEIACVADALSFIRELRNESLTNSQPINALWWEMEAIDDRIRDLDGRFRGL